MKKILFFLSLLNKIIRSNNEIKNNIWAREQNRGIELDGKTIGIIGYGNTGKSLAKKLSGFNVRILCNDILEEISDKYATQVSISEIMKSCDIISLHTNLNDSSFQLINKNFINNCKKPFFLINTSRGEIVNEDDLIIALSTNVIAGAGLDVYNKEPLPENHKLRFVQNALLLPHIGYVTAENYETFYSQMIENLESCLENKPLRIIS